MKRIHFIIVIAFSAMFLSAFRANAQTRFYLGGDAGINLVGTFDEDNHVASLMLALNWDSRSVRGGWSVPS